MAALAGVLAALPLPDPAVRAAAWHRLAGSPRPGPLLAGHILLLLPLPLLICLTHHPVLTPLLLRLPLPRPPPAWQAASGLLGLLAAAAAPALLLLRLAP